MANPSNAVPQKVGFPQAFGNAPYQPTTQFSQFARPVTTVQPQTSASLRGSPFQPPPSSVAQFPSVPNFPANTQAVNGLPQNGPVTTAQPYANVNGPSSAFKPFGTAPTPPIPPGIAAPTPPIPPGIAAPTPPIPPSFLGPHTTMPSPAYPLGKATLTPPIPPSFAGINSAIPSPANPAGTATPPIPPSFPGGSAFPPAPQRPVYPGTYQPAAGLPPAPVNQNNSYNHQASSPFQAQGMPPPMPPMPPIQAKSYQASTRPAPATPNAGMPSSMNQMQQGFSQMNMGPMTTAQHPSHPSWTGAYQNDSRMASSPPYQSDIVDLVAERNILQSGFDDIEYSLPHNMANNTARVDPAVFRCTLAMVPQNEELLKKSRLPFGLTLHPFRDMKNLNIIQTSTIVRCRYCRTYINPYVYLPDSRHWKCNMCSRNNDLPDDFCWDPNTKSFGDPVNRPEIKHPTVEFIAPNEYMLRPPQPAVYVFVLDVSAAAIEAGYLFAFSEQLLINLDQLPGDDRTQIAFVAVDSMVHFFQFNSGSRRLPKELIVDEVDEMFLPTHQGILVSLRKNADVVRSFVEKLPVLFERPSSSSNCIGSALKIVHDLIAEIGGRITVFQATLPTLGPAALKPREDPNQRAGSDVQNLVPATDFYKTLALECTGHQVALDLFMLNTQYADLATLSEIAKFSTGCVYHFPNYHCLNDIIQVKRFEKIFARYLTRKIGFEAVLRIRCSRGLSLSTFYGNFFVRSTDLLALANVNPDSAIAVQVELEEKLSTFVCFQAALLYTSSKGDRRIRVHTMCLPTTADLAQVYNNFDLKAAVSLIAKIGVDRSLTGSPLSDSREAIVNAVVDALGAYQRAMRQGRAGGLLAPRHGHLRLFPLYALAMLKHTSFCAGRSIKLDDRVAAMLMLRFCPLEQILSEFYPQMYRINEILQHEEWPSALPLSFEYISRDGIYLIEAGSALFLYVSSNSPPELIQDLFGCTYQEIDEHSFRTYDNEFSEKVHSFVRHVTALKFYLGPVIIVTEESPIREIVVRRLVDDRTESTHSYVEFLQHIKREINS